MPSSNAPRRHFLAGAACLCLVHGGARAQGSLMTRALMAPPPVSLTPPETERHAIYLSLAQALVCDGWGVDQRRPEHKKAYGTEDPARHFGDYLGHNIGALLVDRTDSIICFALNRNVQLNSTLEHAEARVVRAAIRRANEAKPGEGAGSWTFGSLLQADRLYTTLEPCAQCAGILELANIGQVIYGQDDPSQRHIVNVLHNLRIQPRAPLPVRGTFAPAWSELAGAYQRFVRRAAAGSRTGVTTFLETIEAYRIYKKAAAAFDTMTARHPENQPILQQARAFRARWKDSVQTGLVPV